MADTTEPAEKRASTLEPPSVFMKVFHDMSESSSHGAVAVVTSAKLLVDSPRRRKIETAARVLFVGSLPEDEWEANRMQNKSSRVHGRGLVGRAMLRDPTEC